MSARRRKRGSRPTRRSPSGRSAASDGHAGRQRAALREGATDAPQASPGARATRGRGGAGGSRSPARWSAPSPYPPLFVSLARGMRSVGSWPAPLASCFLGTLALWLVYSAYPSVVSPGPNAMVLVPALAPLHNFLDIQFLASGRQVSAAVVFGFGAGILLVRAGLLALWTSLILEWLRPRAEPLGGGPRPDAEPPNPSVGAAVRAAARSFPVMVGIEGGFLVLALAGVILASGFLGASLGQLLIIGALMGGIYFLSFAPVVAVAEGRGPREAARLSIRASRLPGPRHLILAFAYTALAIFVSLTSPGSRVSEATPPIPVWGYVLLMSFVHVSVLGAFAFRWLTVRHLVPGVGEPSATPSARS